MGLTHGLRLVGVGAMAVMLIVAAGFGTNPIIGNNNQYAFAQEDQEEITTHYDTGLVICNSNDNTPQQCDVPFRVTIETASVLKVGITVIPETCSSTNNYVSVDGDEDEFGGTFIGRAGYSGIGDDTRTILPYDLGPVESGSHTIDIWVEGIPGGCNQGSLYAWGGTLTVITSEEAPEEDTTPPVITVPDDITDEATSPDGAEVSFEVSADDDVDGAVGVNCDYDSGDTFPIGETVVTCRAVDAAGNSAEESFTITVQDTTDPDVEITQAVDRRSNTEIPDGGRTPIPYIRITFEATDAVGIDTTECSLDGGEFTSCTSPVVYDRLSRGAHQVTIRATDEAGNTGEDEFTWTVSNPSAAAPGRA